MIRILRENNAMGCMPLDCIKGATILSAEEADAFFDIGIEKV